MTPYLGDVCQQWKERKVNIDVKIEPSLHLRELICNNGIVIATDRGIHVYRAPIRKRPWRITHRALVEAKKLEQAHSSSTSSPGFWRYRRRPSLSLRSLSARWSPTRTDDLRPRSHKLPQPGARNWSLLLSYQHQSHFRRKLANMNKQPWQHNIFIPLSAKNIMIDIAETRWILKKP